MMRGSASIRVAALLSVLSVPAAAQFTVAPDGSGQFRTVQAAVDAAPERGATIRIQPGVYREHLTVAKSHIALVGMGSTPQDVVLTFDLSAGTAGGTTNSASTTITGTDFLAENLTFENSFSRTHPLTPQGSQAVAVKVNGERAVFRRVRFLGFQDTLYANGAGMRQYFEDCYIEGHVDFIFGNALAWFERCELHALPHSQVMLTAQSKLTANEKSGYVFDHCRVTAAPGADRIWLGRPWRAYASVIFLHTELPAQIVPLGWSEWEHDGKPSLPTVTYDEFDSRGPGANPAAREPRSRQLTAAEAAQYSVKSFLAGTDGWDPTGVRH